MIRTIAAVLLMFGIAAPVWAQTGASDPTGASAPAAAPAQTGASAQATGSAQATASADEGEISRTTNEVSNEVMSPFCPGKTLAMCPSPAAAEVRRDIQEMAREGMGTEEIKQKLIEEYGDEFEIVEPDAFDNTVVLSLIVAGLILCVIVVLLISKRRSERDEDDRDEDNRDSGGDDDGDSRPGGRRDGDSGEDGDVDPYLSALRDEYRS